MKDRIRNDRFLSFLGYFFSIFIFSVFLFCIRKRQSQCLSKDVFTKHYDFFKSKFPPLKVFIYNFSFPFQENVAALQYVNAIKQGLAHTTVFEYIALNSLNSYKHKVDDPENADLFFIPLYGALYNGHREEADIDTVITPMLRSYGDFFDRFGGVDHAIIQMLFSQNNIPVTVFQQQHFPGMFTLGDLDYNYSSEDVRSSWRNINFPLTSNIPQYMDVHSDKQRKISTFFIGQIELSGFDEVAAPIRRGMASNMREIPHSVVINARRYDPVHSVYNYNFSRMMLNSEYCCVPHGDGPTTKRLFDTFRTLCIPIVLSDEIRFPFEDLFVDYSTILLQIPAFKPEQISITMSLPSQQNKVYYRENMIKISKLLEQKFTFDIENGDLMWGWLWVHFYKLATVAASKRRTLLQNAYL